MLLLLFVEWRVQLVFFASSLIWAAADDMYVYILRKRRKQRKKSAIRDRNTENHKFVMKNV